MKRARIYRPARNVMQSGKANTKLWRLEILPEAPSFIEPVMGWTGSSDMYPGEFILKFATKEEAVSYAEKHSLAYEVKEPNEERLKIKAYSDNFK